MKIKDVRDGIFCLIVGGVLGTIVASPLMLPSVQEKLAQVMSGFYSNAVASTSNADHGDTLEEVMDGIRNEEYEYMAVFQGEHKILEITDHDKNQVSYRVLQSANRASDMLRLHNHPAEGSFSYLDLRSICNDHLFQTEIIVSDNIIYTLSAPESWPTLEELNDFLATSYGMEFDSSGDMSISALLLVDLVGDGYFLLDGSGLGFTSKLVSEFADYFDLVYTVEYISSEDSNIVSGYIIMPEN